MQFHHKRIDLTWIIMGLFHSLVTTLTDLRFDEAPNRATKLVDKLFNKFQGSQTMTLKDNEIPGKIFNSSTFLIACTAISSSGSDNRDPVEMQPISSGTLEVEIGMMNINSSLMATDINMVSSFLFAVGRYTPKFLSNNIMMVNDFHVVQHIKQHKLPFN